MPTPPTPPTYWWLTVRIDACRTRDERVAAASGDDAVRVWRELHPNVEVIHVRPVPEFVDTKLEHMSTHNNSHDLLSLDELRDLWNAQADAANSWDALGADEIAWWAQRQALARAGLAQLLAARDALAELHRPDSWSPSTVEPERVAPKSIEERIAEADAAVEASMKRIRKIIATPARQLAAEANRSAVSVPDGPAVPEGREPASVVEEPSDEELLELMPEGFTAPVSVAAAIQSNVLSFARAVLARFGHHSPDATKMVGPAEGDAILALAAIIREVDGNHSLGAAALAEAILSHRNSHWGHQPAPQVEVE